MSEADSSDRERQRRSIRGQYRALITSIAGRSTDLVEEEPMVLKDLIDEADELFTSVTHCREAALDAQCVSSIALLGRKKVSSVSATFDEFNIGEFTQKLIRQLRPDADTTVGLTTGNWVHLGRACQTFFKRSPSLHFMYGSFELEPKPKKEPPNAKERLENRRKDLLKDFEPEVPKERQGFGNEEEGTSLAVDVVHKVLKKLYRKFNSTPICFMEFVVNPHSFSQTVENVFHTSFLIKDGFARIFLDDEGLPVIEPVSSEGDSMTSEVNANTPHQMIMAWTMQGWREIVESYGITEAMIPPRTPKPARN